MFQFVISTLLIAFLTDARQTTPPEVQTPTYDVVEAYEVYAAILPSEWSWKDAKAKRLVISANTTNYNMCLQPDVDSAKLIGPAIADYLQQNKHAWLLKPQLKIEKPYVLLSQGEIESAFQRSPGGWEAFYQMYPESGGIIALSAVGFNPDKTVAVVYSGHSCGSLCGGGGFLILQKKDAKWEPLSWKGSACAWAS